MVYFWWLPFYKSVQVLVEQPLATKGNDKWNAVPGKGLKYRLQWFFKWSWYRVPIVWKINKMLKPTRVRYLHAQNMTNVINYGLHLESKGKQDAKSAKCSRNLVIINSKTWGNGTVRLEFQQHGRQLFRICTQQPFNFRGKTMSRFWCLTLRMREEHEVFLAASCPPMSIND